MKVRMLKTVRGQHGKLRRDEEKDLPDPYVQFLVARGMAVPLHGKEAAKTATGRPSQSARSGGQTGKARQSSSSQAGQASKTSTSAKSKDARE